MQFGLLKIDGKHFNIFAQTRDLFQLFNPIWATVCSIRNGYFQNQNRSKHAMMSCW